MVNKYRITVFFNLLLILIQAQNTKLDWGYSTGGDEQDIGSSIALDQSGNVFVTGKFEDFVDFDPSNQNISYVSKGSSDIFIQKFASNGDLLWAKTIGGLGTDEPHDLVIDNSGNVIITGYFDLTVDFDPSASVYNLTTSGSKDIFILKLDPSGSFIWAEAFGSTSNDAGNAIAIDKSDNIYLTGYFNGTVDFKPGASSLNKTSKGYADLFVLKFNNSGVFRWVKTTGSEGGDVPRDITIDDFGNIILIGEFFKTVDFDFGSATATLTAETWSSVFVLKLDSIGDYVFAKSFNCTDAIYASSVTTGTDGAIYTTGTFENSADFNPLESTGSLVSNGRSDVFICKLDSIGNYNWAKSFGGTSVEDVQAIALNTNDEIIMTGFFYNTVDFDPSNSVTALTSYASSDIYLNKLDTSGQFISATTFGGNSSDHSESIVTDDQNKIYLTGYFRSTAIKFNTAPDISQINNNGIDDSFVLKLTDDYNLTSINGELIIDLLVYPNPTTKQVNISSSQSVKRINVYTLRGSLIISNLNSNIIDISKLKPGSYVVKIGFQSGKWVSKQFIKK